MVALLAITITHRCCAILHGFGGSGRGSSSSRSRSRSSGGRCSLWSSSCWRLGRRGCRAAGTRDPCRGHTARDRLRAAVGIDYSGCTVECAAQVLCLHLLQLKHHLVAVAGTLLVVAVLDDLVVVPVGAPAHTDQAHPPETDRNCPESNPMTFLMMNLTAAPARCSGRRSSLQ